MVDSKVTLPRLEPLTWFDILSPRYHDKVVLLKAEKVKNSKNQWLKVTFSKAPSWQGEWVVSKRVAQAAPLDSNGAAPMRAVPLSELKELVRDNDIRSLI